LTSDAYGNANSAYHFNGVNNYIQIPNNASINMVNKISISLNVKPLGFYASNTCSANEILMKGYSDQLSGNYIVRFGDIANACNNPSTTNQQFSGEGVAAATPLVQLNKWYSIVWTYDGVTAKIYIGGTLISSAVISISSFTNSYDLFLGTTGNPQYPYWFNGDLDEVRIYNRALNDQEAQALALSSATPTITAFSPHQAAMVLL